MESYEISFPRFCGNPDYSERTEPLVKATKPVSRKANTDRKITQIACPDTSSSYCIPLITCYQASGTPVLFLSFFLLQWIGKQKIKKISGISIRRRQIEWICGKADDELANGQPSTMVWSLASSSSTI